MKLESVNKQQLIEKVLASDTNLSSEAVERALDVVLDEISTGLICGDRVEIRGFGSLVVRKRGGGVARNPKNGEKVSVKDRGSLYFRASKDLIKDLNVKTANQ
jgi:integration host factor subunit beta